MSTQVRCHCQSCAMRGLTGPALVITIGILLLLHQIHGGNLSFNNTWPIVFIVLGFLYLGSSMASREGHIQPQAPGVPPSPTTTTAPPPPPAAPYGNPGQ